MALVAVFIAAGLLAQLAVPSQLGQALGLDAVGDLLHRVDQQQNTTHIT